jgi:hypothetical protein
MRQNRHSGLSGGCGLAVGVAALLAAVGVPAALGQTTFQRLHWTGLDDRATSIEQTSDGGYIEVATRTTVGGPSVIVLHKLDQFGVQQWTRVYQTQSGSNTAQSVRATRDGGYIIAGETNAALTVCGGTANGILLLKVDAAGNVQWANGYAGRQFTNLGGSVVRERQGTAGGYVVIGRSTSSSASLGGVIVTTDAGGAQLCGTQYFVPAFGPSQQVSFNDVRQNTDGTYTVFGWMRRAQGQTQQSIAMTTQQFCGSVAWAYTYGNPQETYIGEAMEARANSYVFAGDWRNAAGATGSFAVVTNNVGTGALTRIYRNIHNIQSVRVVPPFNEVAMVGSTIPNGGDVVLMKTDNAAMPIWSRRFGGAGGNDFGHEAIPTSDNGFAIAGYDSSTFGLAPDSSIIKLNSSGDNGCGAQHDVQVQTQDFASPLQMGALDLPVQCRVPIFASQQIVEDRIVCPVRKGCTVPPAGLALWLTMDEVAGGIAVNAAGGNNGTHVGGLAVPNAGTVANSKPYTAGLGQHTNVNTYPAINPGFGSFTLDAWINWSGGTAENPDGVFTIIDKRNVFVSPTGINVNGYLMYLIGNTTGTSATLYGQVGDGPTWSAFNSGITILPNQWTFVSMVVQRGSATGIRFYAAPASATTLTASPAFSSIPFGGPITNTRPFRVAQTSMGLPRRFFGSVDEVEYFNRALTVAQLEQLFDAKNAGKCKTFCSVPLVTNFCFPTQTTAPATATFYNYASAAFSPASYYFYGNPTGFLGSNIPGPLSSQFTPSSGSIGVPFPGFVNLPYTIGRPAAMTAVNLKGAYTMATQWPASGSQWRTCSGLVNDARFLCWNDQWNPNNSTYRFSTGQTGAIGPVRATNNSNSSISTQLRISVLDDQRPGDNDLPPVSLNGLPPGQPIIRTLALQPGQSSEVPITAMFETDSPIASYSILIEADLDGDGEWEPVFSTRVANVIEGTCPGDFNNDGTVDFFDYLDFLAVWSDEQPEGDFNNDGTIDFFDYLDFLDAWNACS